MASCCICYLIFKPNDLLTTTECGHVFHQACIYTWLSTSRINQTCPNCRRQVTHMSLRRLHLNYDEEIQNNSIVHELQKSNINMGDKIKQIERELASAEKKCNAWLKKYDTLLKSKDTYQKRVTKIKEDNHELIEINKNLKKQLSDERKQRKFYQYECTALTEQMNEMQGNR